MGLIRRFSTLGPHVRLALIIAPLLAVGGYIIADHFQPEHPASVPTGPKALRPTAPCRLLEGRCELLHREIALNLSARHLEDGTLRIDLASSVPLTGGLVALGDRPPVQLEVRTGPKGWKAHLPRPSTEEATLRLAVVSGQRRYFAELPLRP